MKLFLLCIVCSIAIAWINQHYLIKTSGDSIHRLTQNNISQFLIFCILTSFIGLRVNYNDTWAYRVGYDQELPFPEYWDTIEFGIGEHNGFFIFRALLKTLGISTQGYILIMAAISVALSLHVLKKYSCNYPLSLFLYFTTNVFLMPAAATKQYFAVLFVMLSIPYVIDGKWVKFLLLVFLAITFHPYAIMFLFLPFLQFKPWCKWTYILLFGALIIGISLESLFDTIIDITTMIGKEYSEDRLYGEGINVFRILVSNVPLVLSFIGRDRIRKNYTRVDNIILNLALLNGAIMFIGYFGTAIYFSRLAGYFTIAQCIVLPNLIRQLPLYTREKKIVKFMMIIGYLGFFMYANKSFDANFSRITIFEYIQNLI